MITISKQLNELIEMYNKSISLLINDNLGKSIFMIETEVIIKSINTKIYGQHFYCEVVDLEKTKSIWMQVDIKYRDTFNVNDIVIVVGNFYLKQKTGNGTTFLNIMAETVVVSKNNTTKTKTNLIDIIKKIPQNPILFPLKEKINIAIILPKSIDAQSRNDIFKKLQDPAVSKLLNITELNCNMKDINEVITAVRNISSDTIDVLAITRGGGDEFDISLFDNMELHRSLSDLYVHRIIGIGHSDDRLLLEMTVDHVAPTPSDLANYIITQLEKNTTYFNLQREVSALKDENKDYKSQIEKLNDERYTHIDENTNDQKFVDFANNDLYIRKTKYSELLKISNQEREELLDQILKKDIQVNEMTNNLATLTKKVEELKNMRNNEEISPYKNYSYRATDNANTKHSNKPDVLKLVIFVIATIELLILIYKF